MPSGVPQNDPRRAQDDPKLAQESPRWFKMRPEATQDDPKRSSRGLTKNEPKPPDEKRIEPRRSQYRLGPPRKGDHQFVLEENAKMPDKVFCPTRLPEGSLFSQVHWGEEVDFPSKWFDDVERGVMSSRARNGNADGFLDRYMPKAVKKEL